MPARWLLIALAQVIVCRGVHGDAIVTTRAMTASTIAEIFVESNEILVELEIGVEDLHAFLDIMPDEVFKRLSSEEIPSGQRRDRFFREGWVLMADGNPLMGSVLDVSATKRLARDEVTGDVLERQPEEAPVVIRATLRFQLDSQTDRLVIRPPADDDGPIANVGFVCYHSGLPVNDFRYLPAQVELALDWSDPWYSQFNNRNLRRQFDAPLLAYLYIEPYEVRKEIIARPVDLQHWIDLGLDGKEIISVEEQERLKARVVEFLQAKNPVMIDGVSRQPEFDRIHFIRRNLRTTGIVEPPEDLPVTSATLGIIFRYPIDRLPEKVTMDWEMFTPRITSIRAATADEAGSLPDEITTESPNLVWVNYLQNPTAAKLRAVPPAPNDETMGLPVLSLAIIVASVALAWRHLTHADEKGRPLSMASVVCAAGLIAAWLCLPIARYEVTLPTTRQASLSDNDAAQVVGSLLYNIYRAFDHHDEGRIYDRLSDSVDGDLLQSTYLETRKSMELKNQGGLRVSVKEIEIQDLEPLNPEENRLSFQCTWQVHGSIGHWGHVHQRTNQHTARLQLAPRDGQWKIVAMESLDERQVGEKSTNQAEQTSNVPTPSSVGTLTSLPKESVLSLASGPR